MEIKSIKTGGFRKFEGKFETDLYKTTNISGKNTSGKTNILYAIVWAFLGSNLTGDDKVWLGNNNSESCFVEIKFIDNNGEEHIIARNKNKYTNSKNFILLDNKKVKQEDIEKFYSDKKLFLSVVNPSYFINKKPAEQKELIDKYLPDIEVKAVYDSLENENKEILTEIPTNIVEYMSELREDKKHKEDLIKKLKGKIEYADLIVKTKIEEKKQFLKEEELSLAKQELSFLLAESNVVDKKKQQEIVNSIEREITQTENQIKSLTLKMNVGKQDYLSIKSETKSHCPTCNQIIENEAKTETIKNMKAELEQFFEEKNKLESGLTDILMKLNMEKCKLYAIDDEKSKVRVKEIEQQILSLEKEKQDINNYNSIINININNIEKAKRDIEIFNNQIREYNKNIEGIKEIMKVTQKLYINYIEEKMRFATNHLKNVKIRFYTVLKDSGELKEDFIITYKDNEFKNLSKSETIATSLELSNMFNKISGVKLPTFIDDSESCADYNFIEEYSDDTQILIAQVKKGQELKIVDYSLENESYLQVA